VCVCYTMLFVAINCIVNAYPVVLCELHLLDSIHYVELLTTNKLFNAALHMLVTL